MSRRRRPDARRGRLLPALVLLFLPVLLSSLFRGGAAPPPAKVPLPPRSASLAPLRISLVDSALSLEGKVGYFWGGKSRCLGWDPRWGVRASVTSPGSDTTGKSLPFGLDCSGLVTWAAVNAAGDPAALESIGNGVKGQYALCTPIPWSQAQPGDLAFFPDLSHVGIVLGHNGNGTLAVVHCSRTLGGVVVSSDAASLGFTLIATPGFYEEYSENKPPGGW